MEDITARSSAKVSDNACKSTLRNSNYCTFKDRVNTHLEYEHFSICAELFSNFNCPKLTVVFYIEKLHLGWLLHDFKSVL